MMSGVAAPPLKRFVVSSVSSDAHTWNLVHLQLLLEELGGEVTNLGACVPDHVVIAECRRLRPDLLVLSTVNGHGHLDGLRLIRRIRRDRRLAGLPVVIGGRLGVRGAQGEGSADVAAGLAASGFDGVFASDDALERFAEFLDSMETLSPGRTVRSRTAVLGPVRDPGGGRCPDLRAA